MTTPPSNTLYYGVNLEGIVIRSAIERIKRPPEIGGVWA